MTVNVLNTAQEKVFTLEEYYTIEEKSLYKNEFRDGKIIAMPNASINHNRICTNLLVRLSIISYQKEIFEVFNSEQKVFAPINAMFYTDTCIVVRPVEKHDKLAITNPKVIFEVSSPSTENYDRRGKFIQYKSIPSFEEYVLVDQDTPSVEVYFKTKLGWVIETYLGLDEEIQLKSIDCTIKMSDIYRNVEDLESPQGQIDFNQKED